MSNDDLIHYIELTKSKFSFENIKVHLLNETHIEILYVFYKKIELRNFVKKMHENRNENSNIQYQDSQLVLNFQIESRELSYEFISNIKFPANTKTIMFIIKSNNLILTQERSHSYLYSPIKLNNLPKKLVQLVIFSNYSFDLNNLPNISILDITNARIKLNINHLPNSLTILKLPSTFNCEYKLDEISNLPNGLKQIYEGNHCYHTLTKYKENIFKRDKIFFSKNTFF